MGNLLKAGLTAACLLFLSACNVEVVTLGEGEVRVISNNAEPCANNDQCLAGGYNRLIELQAQPAEGYVFAGWAGDCEGLGSCTVRTLGSKTVVASFKSQLYIEPLMDYSDAFFFSGPWPTDLKVKADGRIDLQGYPFKQSLFDSAIKRDAAKMHGFARNDAFYVPIATDLVDFDNFYDEFSYDNFQLVNLSPTSPHYLETIRLPVELYRDDNLEKDSLLRLKLPSGYTLDAATTYGLVVYSGEIYGQYQAIRQSKTMARIINEGATGLLQQHWQLISDYVRNQSERPVESVAAFSVFTTQAESTDIEKVRDFVSAYPYDDHVKVYEVHQLTQECDTSPVPAARSEIIQLLVRLPFFLKGKPPFLLSGGSLNLDANGDLQESNEGTDVRIMVSIPCVPSPSAAGYPVEVFALETGGQLQNYLDRDYIDRDNHNAVKFYIAAPYTEDRFYDGGLANLGWVEDLIGVSTDWISVGLGDFNPLNWKAIEPQYLQYAADMIYTYQLATRLSDRLEGRGYSGMLVENTKVDPDSLTFTGISLGALAATNANTLYGENKNLTTVIMPRPNIQHINSVVNGLLKHYISEESLQAIEWVLGVDFPMNLNDPTLSVLQTVIDPIDTGNHLDAMADKNLLIVLSDFEDHLHGGTPAYEFAQAVDRRFTINPLLSAELDTYPNDAYPMLRYNESPYYVYGATVTDQPTRLLTHFYYAKNAVEVFAGQMRNGIFKAETDDYSY